jgi:hypothetical protein
VLARWFTGFDSLSWETWGVSLVGMFFAGLALVLGRSLVGRRTGEEVDAASSPTPTRDQRKAPRRSVVGVPVSLCVPGQDQPIEAWVVNRSSGGLCITVSQPVSAGTVLRVVLQKGEQDPPKVEVRVKWCRAENKHSWDLGCRFVQIPPANVLARFG